MSQKMPTPATVNSTEKGFLPLAEPVFFSIQGEGSDVGMPYVFLRLAGCNLPMEHKVHCKWCDTKYAWYTKDAKEVMSVAQIVLQAEVYPVRRIIITGGEPLYNDIQELIALLFRNHFIIEIQTNGTIPLRTEWGVRYSMDVKCPSSGVSEYNCLDNIRKLKPFDQIKFVCGTREDFDYAKSTLEKYPTRAEVIIQPAYKMIESSVLVEWVKYELPNARFSRQLQKEIYGVRPGV